MSEIFVVAMSLSYISFHFEQVENSNAEVFMYVMGAGGRLESGGGVGSKQSWHCNRGGYRMLRWVVSRPFPERKVGAAAGRHSPALHHTNTGRSINSGSVVSR